MHIESQASDATHLFAHNNGVRCRVSRSRYIRSNLHEIDALKAKLKHNVEIEYKGVQRSESHSSMGESGLKYPN